MQIVMILMETVIFLFFNLIAALVYATLTVCYRIFFGNFQNPVYRVHFPWICGFLLTCIIFLVPDNRVQILILFTLPFIIYAPVPFIEKKTGQILSSTLVFAGASLAALVYAGISTTTSYFLILDSLPGSLVWLVVTLVPAAIIFIGLLSCQRVLIKEPGVNTAEPASRGIPGHCHFTLRESSILFLAVVIVSVSLFFLVAVGYPETAGGFNVYSVQESDIGNRTVVHLTEKDFWEFPLMRLIIRDGMRNGCSENTGNCIASGSYSFGQGVRIRNYQTCVLEYQGRYYSIKKTWIT